MRKTILKSAYTSIVFGRLFFWALRAFNRVFKRGTYSHRDFLAALKKRGFYPQAILDIGAHRGEWGWMAKSVFPQAAVTFIEPQIEMLPFLAQFCKRYPDSQYLNLAVGEAAGELPLNVATDYASSSFYPASSLAVQETRSVEISTIDALLDNGQCPAPDLIKLDIQGYELKALKGGVRTLAQVEVVILEVILYEVFEKQPGFYEVVHFMDENDFVLYDLLHPVNRPYDGALAQVDLVFVKKSHALRSYQGWK